MTESHAADMIALLNTGVEQREVIIKLLYVAASGVGLLFGSATCALMFYAKDSRYWW